MTPEQAQRLIDAANGQIEAVLLEAHRQLTELIVGGTAPRDAVDEVIARVEAAIGQAMAVVFSEFVGQTVGSAAVAQMQVGLVSLSSRLYSEAGAAAEIVRGMVEQHARGLQDARRLALELFEGYDFRPPDAEPLQFNRRNERLPKYLRDALLSDEGLAGQISRAMARMQVNGLTSQALRAAYQGALDAIDEIEDGAAAELLQRRMRVAWFERMRYFATRIAQTELHRAFAQRQAAELLADPDVEFVQWRMSPAHPITDICDYLAGVDRWGLGPGVYPVRLAPVAPAHPHCRCVLSPRLDLTGRALGRPRDGAGLDFMRRIDPEAARRVAGSRERLEEVFAGVDPLEVHNRRTNPTYRVRTVEEVAAASPPVLQGAT